jgi:transposase
MLSELFFRGVGYVRVDRLWRDGATLHVAGQSTRRWARCPLCGRRSRRVRSQYERTRADLPSLGDPVCLHLRVRRFACRVRWCRRRICSGRRPEVAAPFARRTVRLQAQLARVGFALGGAPGERHARASGLAVSRRTLLRLVRATPLPTAGPVRILRIDDWAWRRGCHYGTILVNLETHRVVDLLPDRTAESVAAWLRGHPEVALISRDRAGCYADGARQGAPPARHVADRFHLVKNVTDGFLRSLTPYYAEIRHHAASRS